ncbi:hypothetical protein ACFVZ3_08275 [Kitasatospora purpeofusca]|uniref:hypothetical protein n=1 Tax=Kitasatospora purpeofusca TaxID=67352 RepID=UPI0036758D09
MGSTGTVLVVVRGPSGAGKSSTAARIRSAYGRGLAVVGQDLLRREVLRERDVADGANIALIGLVTRHALDSGFHTVVEGILDAGRYPAPGRRLTEPATLAPARRYEQVRLTYSSEGGW